MITTLMVLEIIVVIAMVTSILLQPGDEGMGSFLGGGGGESFRTKRGLEKFLYYTTIVLAVIFALLSFIIVKFAG